MTKTNRIPAGLGLGVLAGILIWTAPAPDVAAEDKKPVDLLGLTRKRERPQERAYDARIQDYDLDYSYEDAEIRRRREAARLGPRRIAEVDIPEGAPPPAVGSVNSGLRMTPAAPPGIRRDEDDRSRNWIRPPTPEGLEGESRPPALWEDTGRSQDLLETYQGLLGDPDRQPAESDSRQPAANSLQDAGMESSEDAMLLMDDGQISAAVEEARRERMLGMDQEEYTPVIAHSLFMDDVQAGIGMAAEARAERPAEAETEAAGAGAAAGGERPAPTAALTVGMQAETETVAAPTAGTTTDEPYTGGGGVAFFRHVLGAGRVLPITLPSAGLGGPDASAAQAGQPNAWLGGLTPRPAGAMDGTAQLGSSGDFGVFNTAGDGFEPAGIRGFEGFEPASVDRDSFAAPDPVRTWNPQLEMPEITADRMLPSAFGATPGVGNPLDAGARDPFRAIDQFQTRGPRAGSAVPSGFGGDVPDQRFQILMK
jgi:hypothetical protein